MGVYHPVSSTRLVGRLRENPFPCLVPLQSLAPGFLSPQLSTFWPFCPWLLLPSQPPTPMPDFLVSIYITFMIAMSLPGVSVTPGSVTLLPVRRQLLPFHPSVWVFGKKERNMARFSLLRNSPYHIGTPPKPWLSTYVFWFLALFPDAERNCLCKRRWPCSPQTRIHSSPTPCNSKLPTIHSGAPFFASLAIQNSLRGQPSHGYSWQRHHPQGQTLQPAGL